MKSSQYTPDHPEYVPLSVVLMSVYFAGFFESFCVFLVILGSGAVVSALGLSALSLSLDQATKVVLISYLIFPLVTTLAQRPLVVRAQHPSPGGRLFAAYEILVPPPVYLVVALAVTQDIGKAVMVGVCALVFYLLAYATVRKPWKPGFTRTEVRSKIEQTKQMTREMIGEAAQERAETMQKNAEVDDPAVKDLFLPGNRYRVPLDHDERRP